jgi:hypothetical protein
MSWNDFNTADDQNSYDLIPKGTLARVRMTIRPGGLNDPAQGWTEGYATRGKSTDSVYLDCEFVILEGKYAKRKIWSLIGLYSPKGPDWGNQGRAFLSRELKYHWINLRKFCIHRCDGQIKKCFECKDNYQRSSRFR